MEDNMSDMMKNLSSMLGGKEIPNNVKDMLNSVINNSSKSTSNADSSANANNNDFSNIDINTILKMQQIMKSINSEQSSSRVNLLRSLKPYLNPNRQDKVEHIFSYLTWKKFLK